MCTVANEITVSEEPNKRESKVSSIGTAANVSTVSEEPIGEKMVKFSLYDCSQWEFISVDGTAKILFLIACSSD